MSLQIVPVADIPSKALATPRDGIEVFKVCKKMEAICLKHKGIGLSAVQVGVPWRLFILQNFSHKTTKLTGKFRCFVDCEYSPLGDGKTPSLEGCLSLPNKLYLVQRWKDFTVDGQELILQLQQPTFIDCKLTFHYDKPVPPKSVRDRDEFLQMTHLRHAAFQHEIDHHRNILIRDIGQEVQPRNPISFLGE